MPHLVLSDVPSTVVRDVADAFVNAKAAARAAAVLRVLPREFYDGFVSALSKSRKPSPIRHLFPMELVPGMLSMLAGKPDPSTFPFTSLSMTVRSPIPSTSILAQNQDARIDIDGSTLSHALQYGMTSGMPEFLSWIANMMAEVHGRKHGEGWKVMIGPGSQDLLYKAFLALVDPGDSILVEEPTYAGIIPILETLKCNVVEVATDADGLVPRSLESILSNWPRNKPLPKLLYTVPYGSNPTGATIPLERRLQVLAIARAYNFLILEDDPYYHLFFGAEPRPPSYFSLERRGPGAVVGRVLRFDSFSKILSAGLRLGWATGPEYLLTVMELHAGCSSMQPASTSQIMALSLLKHWGISGFISHTEHISAFYRQRRDLFEGLLQRHLVGLAEWTMPTAGMFFWLKLLLPPTVECTTVGVATEEGDSSVLIRTQAVHAGVLVLPGEASYYDGRRSACVRVSFSLLDEVEANEALRRLAAVLQEAWRIACDSPPLEPLSPGSVNSQLA